MNLVLFYRRALRWGVYWILFLGAALGFILFWRRCADGFPAVGWQLPLTALVFILLSGLLRFVSSMVFTNQYDTRRRIGALLIPTGALYLGAVFRQEAMPELFLMMIVVFTTHFVFWFWALELENKPNHSDKIPSDTKSSADEKALANTSDSASSNQDWSSAAEWDSNPDSAEEPDEDWESQFPEDVSQSWTRQKDDSGVDMQTGWFRVIISAGQKNASINAVFSPPFLQTPQTEYEILDGPEMNVSIPVCLPHGVRIDLRLNSRSPMEQQALIRFTAKEKNRDE